MSKQELIRAQQTLGLTGPAMAKLMGIGVRSYGYRLSGERAVAKGEAKLVRDAVANHTRKTS